MMNIYIPTLNRVGRQPTLKSIPNNWLPYTKLVVHISEEKEYINKYGRDIVLPTKEQGIANVRQWIMEQAQSKYALFLDDDMVFGTRITGTTRLRNSTKKDMDDMFILLLDWLEEGLIHVGISQRAGNNRILDDFVEVSRMNNVYAYNVQRFINEDIKFNRLQVMEDFDVTLSLLKKGIKNRVSYKYVWGQRKSGDDGGCSEYRTPQVQHDAAIQLSKLHSGLVRIISKESKEQWRGFDNKFRTDVVISWKKAYKPKPKKHGITNFLK